MNNLALTLQAQGDLTGARRLQKQVVERRGRVLGAEPPHTTVSAFNLHMTLVKAGAPELARSVFTQHMAWLLERDPATLGADQRQIRDRLPKLVGHDSPSGAE